MNAHGVIVVSIVVIVVAGSAVDGGDRFTKELFVQVVFEGGVHGVK